MNVTRNQRTVDVIIPTWNSGEMLEEVLAAIRKHIDPDGILVVDRNSLDETQEIARKFGCEVLTDTTSLGSARMTGISSSRADFIIFIDDDIIIHEGFMEKLMQFMDDDTGAVQGAPLPIEPGQRKRTREKWENLTRKKGFFILKSGERGYTNCTIIKRDLISNVQIADLNSFEDWVIANLVLKRGYSWKFVPVYVDHHHIVNSVISKYGWNGAGVWNLARTRRMRKMKAIGYFVRYAANHPFDMIDDLRYDDPKNFFFHLKALVGAILSPLYLIKEYSRN
jgi:glycosyltransferase involved in cell wall biosynthesis